VPEEQCAYVVVRYATEADEIARARLSARKETRVSGDPKVGVQVTEVTTENVRERMALEVYLTVKEVANLKSGDGEVLSARPLKTWRQERFLAVWGSLPPVITDAIHTAVRLTNTNWSWGE